MKKLNWDEYFLSVAKISALRSKDENTKVGAVIINDKNRIIATGYNGMPLGNDDFPWDREAPETKDTKYPYVIHAELNAILNATTSVEGATLYVTLYPCSNCAKMLAQAGIKLIKYIDNKYEGTEDQLISKYILDTCGVKTQKIDDIKICL